MLKRGLESLAATWLAGLLVLLPLALTLAVLAWVFSLVNRLVGPGSTVGQLFAALGYPFSSHARLAYLFGALVLVVVIYLLGVVVRSGLRGSVATDDRSHAAAHSGGRRRVQRRRPVDGHHAADGSRLIAWRWSPTLERLRCGQTEGQGVRHVPLRPVSGSVRSRHPRPRSDTRTVPHVGEAVKKPQPRPVIDNARAGSADGSSDVFGFQALRRADRRCSRRAWSESPRGDPAEAPGTPPRSTWI
jgi:hypothetical protein